jgi:hypothetical protein
MFNIFRANQRRRRSRASCRRCGSRFHRLRSAALAALTGVTGLAGHGWPALSQQLPPVNVPQQKIQPAGFKAPGAAVEMPLDQPLRLLQEAQQAYSQIQTYECVLVSQERVNGRLLPEKVMQMTFRKNPFSVYMKWLAPKEDVGQEVCFVQGKYQNMMRVLPAGFAKGFGWMTIEVNDPKVMQHSRHKITEAGFGNWIDRCAQSWSVERTMGKTNVQIADYDYNNRRCVRVETTHTSYDRSFYCYRNVIYFDKQTHLPIRMECYDWPRQGGPPEGELLECFSYINLQFNVNIPESVFTH